MNEIRESDMIIFISILITLIILFYVNAFIFRQKLNPIDSITFNGCMGFKINDDYNFVLSRIRHLKLLSSTDKETHSFLSKYVDYMPIEAYSDMFNNVKSMQFIFTDLGKLQKLHVYIKPDDYDLASMYGVLIVRLEGLLGNAVIEGENYSEWVSGERKVFLEFSLNKLIICIS